MEFGARTQRRMLRRAITASVISVVCAVSLVACAPPAPKPTPTATTIFASEEEALAAATDTYAKYSAAFDEASSRGGTDKSGLENYVTEAHFAELTAPGRLEENGWHTTGASSFHNVAIDLLEDDGESAQVVLNLCRDVSGVIVLGIDGTDVTPADRPDVLPLTVTFVSVADSPQTLVVSKVESWLEDPRC